ncbi:glycoside hydrolase family 13 protein [Bifidobacterium lemurum]|nr:glycoside hydrolase family 13 protein [Bifidobacterium lemurum]QOL35153.1 glycoside hydrolase family 13 protein [Bifidobacterium lemurum]
MKALVSFGETNTVARGDSVSENIQNAVVDDPALWWKQAVVYQVYPRSFKDSTGSGLGDIAGVTSKVPYLKRLGVDAIWLSPFYPSQLADGGYDVDDYRNVDPKLGTMDDFDELARTAHQAGIKIVVDIVPNHSSNLHEWFQAALAAGPGSPERDRYIFRDGRGPNGDLPPTDWVASFGGPAWTRVDDGQWYLHMFTVEQPDWNWNNPEVRADFRKTLRFWLDHGADGFRVDVAHGLAKDLDRDDLDDWAIILPSLPSDGSHPLYDRDDVHEIYREWREVFNEYDPPAFAVAEAWVNPERQHLYASTDELGQVFNFEFAKTDWIRDDMHLAIEEGLDSARVSGSTATWVMSNHDVPRHASRYGLPQVPAASHHQIAKDWLLRNGGSYKEDRELGTRRARAAILMELALPGSAYIYQGEELGLFEVADIPWDQLEDPTAFHSARHQIEKGRDGCRVPLPWKSDDSDGTVGYGFSPALKVAGAGVAAEQAGEPAERPHLPQPAWYADLAADAQESDPDSMLSLYRRALDLRHRHMPQDTDLVWLDEDRASDKRDGADGRHGGVIAYRRSNGWASITNFGETPVELPAGEPLLASGALTEDGRLPQDTTVWLLLD